MSETKRPPEPTPGDKPEDKPAKVERPDGIYCDLCGTQMFEWHCRIVCPACGYQRDCSDP